MSKTISAILMLLLLTASANWGLVVINDDFEIYSNGSTLVGQSGWTGPDFMGGYGTPDTNGPIVTTSPVSGGSRAAKWQCMPGTDTKSVTVTNYFPAEWTNGTAVMYIDLAMDATNGPAAPYGNFSYFQIYDSMGNEATRIYLRRNGGTTGDIHLLGRTGSISGETSLPNVVVNPANNTYYKLKLQIDITNRKYDCYVGDGDRSGVNNGHWGRYLDGVLTLDGVPAVDDLYFFYPATGLHRFVWLMYRYGDKFAGPSYAYCDNLYIEGPDDALASRSAEIWVAKGTYTEKVQMPAYAAIYGGFAGNENSKANRTGTANTTTINAGDSSVGSSAVTGNTASVVDGFTITGGYYGVNCANTSVEVANNVIRSNAQAGIYCNSNSAEITNNTIVGSKIGIDCVTNSPVLSSNIVAYNNTGIVSGGGSPSLANNDVYGNTANYSGLSAGLTDVSVDPMFANAQSGDYHLLLGSPCIDTGSEACSLTWDKDGGWRIVDGDGDGTGTVDIGAFEFQTTPTIGLPSGVKKLAGQSIVRLNQMVVTAAWPDYFYVEDDNRTCGIRVRKTSHGLQPDMRADVVGRLALTTDDELCVDAAIAKQNGSGSLTPMAFAVQNLGGSGFWYDPIAGTGQRGLNATRSYRDEEGFVVNVPYNIPGMNNIGLLVVIWGKTTPNDSTSFYLDDGSNCNDNDPDKRGVRVIVPVGYNLSNLPAKAQVIGISSCYKTVDGLFRTIRVDEPGDIVPID